MFNDLHRCTVPSSSCVWTLLTCVRVGLSGTGGRADGRDRTGVSRPQKPPVNTEVWRWFDRLTGRLGVVRTPGGDTFSPGDSDRPPPASSVVQVSRYTGPTHSDWPLVTGFRLLAIGHCSLVIHWPVVTGGHWLARLAGGSSASRRITAGGAAGEASGGDDGPGFGRCRSLVIWCNHTGHRALGC